MKNFKIIIKLAWRNVWRNKRRTVLTLLTILIGSAMIIVLNAFHRGSHDQMIEEAISANIGHIQIHEKDYWDVRTIDYAFQPDEKLIKALTDDNRIAYFSKRIHADCLVSFKDTSAGAMIQGIDPVGEKHISNFHKNILSGGRFIKPDDKTQVVIGEILAKNIGAQVGNRITMISQGFDGSMAAEKLEIVGLFRSGNPEYDQGLILMPITKAADTFSMMGYIHSITVRLNSSKDTENVIEYLKKFVDIKSYEILGWDELIPEIVQYILMDDIGGYIFSFILFMVVAFGVLNTIQMTIFERTRELGVMLAIGTRPGHVVSMVMTESFLISILGIIGGLILGFAISNYFYFHPIDISNYAEEMAMWGMSANTGIPAYASPINGSLTAILTLILALFFSIFPARKAAGLKPIDAIRHL